MEYTKTIGIEVHAELKSKTKMFSDALNSYGTTANSNITFLDLGYPGTLPLVNLGAMELALKAALVLHCEIHQEMYFDRKNYFYPDLPKGYQITQARTPIGINGYVEIEVGSEIKRIRIHDIHVEEDTAKSIHQETHSYLDFNRSGVPLIEIVTEPDMHSAEEATLYLEKLRELLLYTDISDCKIEEGSMRCDVNVSVSKNDTLGTRTETKNIGSIRSVGMAIDSEAKRQVILLEEGQTIKEETRRYDDKQNVTVLMRVKETGNDYRYYPEPDIPAVFLEDEFIKRVEESIPVMPDERRRIYQKAGISLQNANKLIQNRAFSDFLLGLEHINLVIASNLLLGDIASYLNQKGVSLEETTLTRNRFEDLVSQLDSGKISHKIWKDLVVDYLETTDSIDTLMTKKGITTIQDTGLLTSIIKEVLANNQASIEDYRAGHDRALKFLMGQIMKESKGSADPKTASQILLDLLGTQNEN